MNPVTVTGQDLSKICRLCLTPSVKMTGIFCFPPKLGEEIADLIMQCAPVQITRHDNMPSSICQLCYIQLKKAHKFQMQIVKSDKILRRHQKQLNPSHQPIKLECAAEEGPSEDPLNQASSSDIIVKCEPSEINYTFDEAFKLENVFIKEEPVDYNSLNRIECTDDAINSLSNVNCNASNRAEIKFEIGDTKVGQDVENPCFIDDINNSECSDKRESEKNKKLYHCDACEMCFKQLYHFKKHKLTHTGEKPHQCDVCKMCFRHPGTLNRHKLTHTGEKPYQCDVCKMFFRHLNTLNRHTLTHTGEKPHQCDVCKMCFRQPGTLNRHKLTHTGEKPHKCDICKLCFRQPGTLNIHKLIHREVTFL